MSEIVERVARALFASAMRDVCREHRKSWDDIPTAWQDNHRHSARAAIAAMRDATPEMIAAGSQFERPVNVWSAMIDAALGEGK